jgi:hypothetical protein
MKKILVTGAAGGIGSRLRTLLKGIYPQIRWSDIRKPDDLASDEEFVQADLADYAAVEKLAAGVNGIVHLGGYSVEGPWETILSANIIGARNIYEAAYRQGVERVVFASSNHAVGFTPRDAFPVPDEAAPVPDTYYGVSKAAGEALAALYAHRYGLEAICVRILSCFDRPRDARMLATWLSPDDAGRLFEACLTAPAPGFRVIYGVSANTRGGWVSLDGARALGYEPRDDAEAHAAEVLHATRTPAEAPPPPGNAWPEHADPVFRYLGGEFTFPSRDAPVPPAG